MKINKEQFRTDIDEYFKLSGIREYSKLNHTPFIVLGDKIELVFSAKELVENFKPETEIISQWRGNYNSDFFYFRVSDLIDYISKNPKQDYHKI